MNIYLEITKKFNNNRFRAVITSGQAVVLHRLAIMSKDGVWILREDEECLNHIISVLDSYGAKYRFGAPLSLDWLRFGWSSHFEFIADNKRIRTDFFTRAPRIDPSKIAKIWDNYKEPPFISAPDLAETKKTMRLKDYAIIGELARIMKEPNEMILFSRSARDLFQLRDKHPKVYSSLYEKRPILKSIEFGLDHLEKVLFDEQLILMREDERRLAKYNEASENFKNNWLELNKKISNLPLLKAHDIMIKAAENNLPKDVLHV